MRIGCLQFSPQVGDIENNLNRADAVLSKANPDELDLLVLPELAFSGYNFRSLQDIAPFLEPSGSGISSLWARTMALKYNCTVTVGYPEKVDVSSNWPTGPEYYNSTIVVNGDGETIANYRKRFLYYTDESWALEGDQGFYEGCIPGLGNTSIGICMDLNPYKFEAPWHAFEFAFHVLEVESNLVILSMAWMTREERRRYTRMPNEPDMETLTYWVTRLEPLIRSNSKDEIVVVFCNRTGVEDDVTYAGTSAVIGILDGEVNVYGLLGRGEKELLVVDTNNPPYAKLVYRPTERGAQTPLGSLANPSEPVSWEKQKPPTQEDPKQSSTSLNSQSPPQGAGTPRDSASTGQGPMKKRAAPITIPRGGSAFSSTSPTAEFNIPTPSAPSPTPMAVRPRLIIPESSVPPHRYTGDHPASASSMVSAHSIKSQDSEASVQTVRSNPRPPEDSTPYPHSGSQPSGYPGNRWETEKRIYGGNVTFDHYEGLSPVSSSVDESTVPTVNSWRRTDSPLRTSHKVANTWTSGTPIGKKPEPFPWSKISANMEPSRKPAEVSNKKDEMGAAESATGNRRPQSPSISSSPARAVASTGVDHTTRNPVHQVDRLDATARHGNRPFRPSPDPRDGSRLDPVKRASSTIHTRNPGSVRASQSQSVSQRASSASALREKSTQGSGDELPWAVDRPKSPKSRNCSRSRPSDPTDLRLADPHMIPIVASPSIFRCDASTPDAKRFYQSSSPASFRQRSTATPLDAETSSSNRGTPSGATKATPTQATPRTTSRGRQPRANESDALTQGRSSSKDTIFNNQLHTRVSRRESRESGRPSQSGRRSSRSSNHPPTPAQYERIEVVSCSNCPVHGQHSDSSTSDRSTPEPAQLTHSYSWPSLDPGMPQDHAEKLHDNSCPTASKQTISLEAFERPLSEPTHRTAKVSADTRSIQTGSAGSPKSSPAASSSFDPPTPKAMAFQIGDLAVPES